jgi:hypothetical protein
LIERVVADAMRELGGHSRHAAVRECMRLAMEQVTPQLELFQRVDAALAQEWLDGTPPPSREVRAAAIRDAALAHLGWTVERGPSGLKGAGVGVIARGEVPVGAVVAFYPGVVYTPRHHTSLPGYPNITADNEYLIMRYDRTIIDAQGLGGGGGESSRIDDRPPVTTVDVDGGDSSVALDGGSKTSAVAPNDTGLHSTKQQGWHLPARESLTPPLEAGHPFFAPGVRAGDAFTELNPHALAHLINHPSTAGRALEPNVLGLQVNFPVEFTGPLGAYVPNRYHARPGVVDALRWPEIHAVRGLVLVCVEPIGDGEELLVDYRLHPRSQRPEWYADVDTDAATRRWGGNPKGN